MFSVSIVPRSSVNSVFLLLMVRSEQNCVEALAVSLSSLGCAHVARTSSGSIFHP